MFGAEDMTTAADLGNTVIEVRGNLSLFRNDKFSGRKKLSLTPELRRLSFGSIKTQCSYSDSKLNNFNGNGFRRMENIPITLEENVELISKNLSVERKYFQEFIDSLQSQVVQLEEKIYSKTVKIENLQLYNSDSIKIINSLTTALNETKWKRDTMLRICAENVPNKLYKSMLMISFVSDKISVFRSYQEKLQSFLIDFKENDSQMLIEIIQQIKSGLDEFINVIEKVSGRKLSGSLFNENDFDDTIKTIIHKIPNGQTYDSQTNDLSGINLLETSYNDGDNIENLIKLWEIAKDLNQKNRCLSNRVTSLNMHKIGLQLQLDDLENNTKELERKTMTEIEEVEKKEEILNHNESMIQQHWDEMDTSQEIVLQTQRAQEIDQELGDLQTEYHNRDRENKQLKTNLSHLKNDLIEYKLKCEQLEIENKQIENEKNDILEAYAKSWGHHNSKQKIKYTGRLIKDIDSITQEIKGLELEIEKQELNISPIVRTPVFIKTQPKSEKILRTFGIIDTNKRQNLGLFRENVVRNLRYQ